MQVLYQRLKRQILSRVALVRLGLLVVVVAGILGLYSGVIRPLVFRIWPFVQASQAKLATQSGRTNFLLLGVAGGDSAGATLTDTIILVSVDSKIGDVAVLSIPRDVWVPSMRAKINTAYYYGNQKQAIGGGLLLARSAVGEILDVPVHYAAVIDFSGFEKIIDLLDGVDVTIERAFTDEKYPIAGRENDTCNGDEKYRCRYETLTFIAGSQHLDGATALKFARSRQAIGEEGTDFARSKRQEKIIVAIREKVLSTTILTDLVKIRQLYQTVVDIVETDITAQLYPTIIKLGISLAKIDLRTSTLSVDLFVNPPSGSKYDYQWVLIPRDTASVSAYVKDFLFSQVKN